MKMLILRDKLRRLNRKGPIGLRMRPGLLLPDLLLRSATPCSWNKWTLSCRRGLSSCRKGKRIWLSILWSSRRKRVDLYLLVKFMILRNKKYNIIWKYFNRSIFTNHIFRLEQIWTQRLFFSWKFDLLNWGKRNFYGFLDYFLRYVIRLIYVKF